MWRKIRIMALLGILVFVSGQTISQQLRVSSWERPLDVVIYPVKGDNSIITTRYVDQLRRDDFAGIERFMRRQARDYGIEGDILRIRLAPQSRSLPPDPPARGGFLQTVAYSLYLRAWAAWHDNRAYPGDIRIFVVYHDPDVTPEAPHSLALRKGMIGLVHAFADKSMQSTNNFVINHELLHTLGATDKYDPDTNQPYYPEGLARPFQKDPFHQKKAEIMGGRIPMGPWDAVMPGSLDEATIGSYTALEIHWFN